MGAARDGLIYSSSSSRLERGRGWDEEILFRGGWIREFFFFLSFFLSSFFVFFSS